MFHKGSSQGNSLEVQWLGFRDFTAEGLGSISGRGTKMARDPKASHLVQLKRIQPGR